LDERESRSTPIAGLQRTALLQSREGRRLDVVSEAPAVDEQREYGQRDGARPLTSALQSSDDCVSSLASVSAAATKTLATRGGQKSVLF
jgi:hypothetical protein